jgi:ferritin
MLCKPLEKALNEQIKNELYSSYLYLAMSSWFSANDLKGMAQWMLIQAKEEDLHAMKFFDYVLEHGNRVDLKALDQPPSEFKSPLDIFEQAYRHEQKVTKNIRDLVSLAREHNDHATESFLAWYSLEQVEEEASADDVVQQLKLVGDKGNGLLMLDRLLGQRVFVPPAAEGAA